VGPDGRPLQATRGPGIRTHPAWAPTGRRLTYAARLPGEDPDLWILDVETGTRTRLTDSPAEELHPAWSPDGLRIAYVLRGDEGGAELWTVAADGTDAQRLTDTPGREERHPAWAADGASLLVEVVENGMPALWRIPLDDAPPSRLTDPATQGPAADPAWLRPGGPVVFVRRSEGGGRDLWTVEGDGSRPVRLTELGAELGGPAPSPDGRNLAFHSDHGGRPAIHLLRMATGDVVFVAGPGAPAPR
jgi:Tol biopolymer transport system component